MCREGLVVGEPPSPAQTRLGMATRPAIRRRAVRMTPARPILRWPFTALSVMATSMVPTGCSTSTSGVSPSGGRAIPSAIVPLRQIQAETQIAPLTA